MNGLRGQLNKRTRTHRCSSVTVSLIYVQMHILFGVSFAFVIQDTPTPSVCGEKNENVLWNHLLEISKRHTRIEMSVKCIIDQ